MNDTVFKHHSYIN